jgi:GAF domain-containing protein
LNSDRSNDDQIRVKRLHDYNVLDTPPELDFDELTHLVAQVCDVPTAIISFVDQDRQWFKARVGTELQETARAISFCTHTVKLAEDQLFVINDTHADPRFADNPLVTGPEQIRFYAGAPIVTRDGYAIGALCAIDHKPRTLAEPEMEALRALARHVMNDLEMRRLHHAHMQARVELQLTRSELEALCTQLADRRL